MAQLKEHLARFSSCGFTTLPLDQAQEAWWQSSYFLAFKLIPNKTDQSKTQGLQLILGNMKQFAYFFPNEACESPCVRLGFCGQTIFINDKAFLLRDLSSNDNMDQDVKEN